ncbi:MAG: cytochrome c oxidase subunit II [Rhodobacteraceae bacterium]|nr:cytochrome c oxidase subunit II [Paracoccaceae bacterium]
MCAGTALMSLAGTARAQDHVLPDLEVLGAPGQDGLGFQAPATEMMRDLIWLDTFLLYIITGISLFVTVLLVYCILRFNKRANPNPATFTHHSVLEITWTVVPILILIAIIPPSLTLLFKQQEIPEADITIKAVGNQWYWSHEYVDHGFVFDSFMLQRDELADAGYDQKDFLLATDTAVVVPTGKIIVVQVTASDVIHSWTIPAFGVKQDAVPGRLAELWFKVDEGKEGIYFGQCSELCGKDHSYMPITVKAVTQADYEKWIVAAQEEYAGMKTDTRVAYDNRMTVYPVKAAN